MNNNRKEVNDFLIGLDVFLKEYKDILSEEQILDLTIPLRVGLPSKSGPKKTIPFSTLLPLINKTTGQKIRRGDNYVMRVAYKLKYIKVKGCSYNEIFIKILGLDNKQNTLIIHDFYNKDFGKDFIIPEDYGQINNDMYYTKSYDIIK